MKKFFRYIQQRHTFYRHFPKVPDDTTVSWCEWLVLEAVREESKPIVALHTVLKEWYGVLGEACSTRVMDIAFELQERKLVKVDFRETRPHQQLVKITQKGVATLELYPSRSSG